MNLRIAAACLFAPMLSGPSCTSVTRDVLAYDAAAYRGDGRMVDHGERAASERFELRLGKVDFGREETHTFRMGGLPAANLTAGFELTGLPPMKAISNENSRFNRSQVHILLKSLQGDVLFEDSSALSEWTWGGRIHGSERFVYLREQPGRNVGSSFVPKQDQDYVLTVKIRPLPGSASVKPAEVMIFGGGWKVP